jgi:hypothetical protein
MLANLTVRAWRGPTGQSIPTSLVINTRTAKALGIGVPPMLLSRAHRNTLYLSSVVRACHLT